MVKGESYYQAISSSIEDRSSPNRIEVAPTKRILFRVKESSTSTILQNPAPIKPISSAANAPRHAKTDSSSSFHSCQEDPISTSKSKSPTPISLDFSLPKGPRILDNISKSPTPLSSSVSLPKSPRIPVGTPTGPKAWRSRSIDYSPSISVRKLLSSAKPYTDPLKPFLNSAKEASEFRLSRTTSLRDRTNGRVESLDSKIKGYHPAGTLLGALEFNSTSSSTPKKKGIDEARLSPSVSLNRERRKHQSRKRDEEVFGKVYIKPEKLYNDHYSPHPSRETSPDRKEGRRSRAQQRKEKRERDSKERLKRKEREEKKDLTTIPVTKGRNMELKSHSATIHSRHVDSQAPPKLSMLLAPIVVLPQPLSSSVKSKEVCYNCGRQGHWFMDCVTGCGRCGGDGHRTIDCPILYRNIGRAEDVVMDGC